MLVFVIELFIMFTAKQTQLITLQTEQTIRFQMSKDQQQQCKTFIDSVLCTQDWDGFVNWIKSNPIRYNDLNADGQIDSVYTITYIGKSSSIGEFCICHYLIPYDYWGQTDYAITSIPLETNLNKKIKVLPNRYTIPPRIGLLYKVNTANNTLLSIKKISILHSIE
jgi:hypothetical protein